MRDYKPKSASVDPLEDEELPAMRDYKPELPPPVDPLIGALCVIAGVLIICAAFLALFIFAHAITG